MTDSRTYRFIFSVQRSEDLPADFPLLRHLPFVTAVFIPQDDQRPFAERPAYPASLLILQEQKLLIVTHPTWGAEPQSIALSSVHAIVVVRSLLLGGLCFQTDSQQFRVSFNTRCSRPLDEFALQLHERWLSSAGFPMQEDVSQPVRFGPSADISFGNMLADTLLPGELVFIQLFVPPEARLRKRFALSRSCVHPGHLLALTTRGRLLWLTDMQRGQRLRYAANVQSVRAAIFREAALHCANGQDVLEIGFAPGVDWRVPIHSRQEDGRQFALLLARTLSESDARTNRSDSV